MTHRAQIGALFVLACASSGCTWTRFDDILDNPPVERFDAPTGTSGLGTALAVFPTTIGWRLVASASDRVVAYDLGSGTDPSTTAATTESCVGDNSCVLAAHLTALKSQSLTGNLGCAAYGFGSRTDSSGTPSWNLWLSCDGSSRSLDLPQTAVDWLSAPNRFVTAQTVFEVAAPHRIDTPALAAALPDAAAIWFYADSSVQPVELPSLPNAQTAGRALAVIPYYDSDNNMAYIVAASSVTSNDTVWLFQVVPSATPSIVGCLSGSPQFGSLLATGNFDSDGIDDLLVADSTAVYAIAGSSLKALQPNSTPSCTPIGSAQVIARATCANLTDLNGCVGSGFASSIAAANLDGNPPDELIVGVQDTAVRGESAAGAVFLYRMGNKSFDVADGLFVSSASSEDRLGTSVATAAVSAVDSVLAGSPGDDSVMEFFCNRLMPAASRSARCP